MTTTGSNRIKSPAGAGLAEALLLPSKIIVTRLCDVRGPLVLTQINHGLLKNAGMITLCSTSHVGIRACSRTKGLDCLPMSGPFDSSRYQAGQVKQLFLVRIERLHISEQVEELVCIEEPDRQHVGPWHAVEHLVQRLFRPVAGDPAQ